MMYENRQRNQGRAKVCAVKTLNLLKARRKAVQAELDTVTYDAFSESVRSLSGFFRAYSVLLVLALVVMLGSSFI